MSGNEEVFKAGISRPPDLLNFPINFVLHKFLVLPQIYAEDTPY